MTSFDWSHVLDWLQSEARFAQLTTINEGGWPVTRTVGAPINADWSVDLVQRRAHRRIGHLRREPRLALTWAGSPADGARNDRPAVFDYGWLVPRVVIIRGIAEFRDADWTVARYRALTASLTERGGGSAVRRSDANVREELVGVHVRPVVVRAEGFGKAAQSFTRKWENT